MIRYPRGGGVLKDWRCPFEEIKVGTGRRLREGKDVAVLSIGAIGNEALQAAEATGAAMYDMRFLRPLDEKLLEEIGQKYQRVVTVENGVRNGGLGSAVMEWLGDHGYQTRVTRLGLPDDHFVEHGTVAELQRLVGLDKESIMRAIRSKD